MSEKPEAWRAIDSLIWPHIAANLIREQHAELERMKDENERLQEENRLWYSRACALFWKGHSDNITVGRLQSAAKEIDAALRREEAGP